jgi:DNA-binding NarL/FixJ family response regulator
MSGAQATAELTRAKPEIFVIMLTVAADEASVIEAILAGACGYLLKDAAIEEVVAAVRAGAHGESLITPRIATDLLRLVRAGSGAIGARRPQLTEREQEVLRLLIEGRDNAEIAQALFISPSTVKNHVSSILDKLDVDNRVQAAVRAVRDRLA